MEQPPPVRVRFFRTEVPRDFRTFALAFFIGSILSAPLGILLAPFKPFDLPTWTVTFYCGAWLGSLIILPILSVHGFRDQPILQRLGKGAFLLGFFLFFFVLLYPLLQELPVPHLPGPERFKRFFEVYGS